MKMEFRVISVLPPNGFTLEISLVFFVIYGKVRIYIAECYQSSKII